MRRSVVEAPLDRRLLKEAEVEAERLISVLRIVAALGLLAVFAFAIGTPSENTPAFLKRQWIFAVLTLSACLVLGLGSFWLAWSGRFRSWMIWPVATLDCVLVLFNTYVALLNTGLPGSLTFMLPPIWLVPVILGFAVLRFNAAHMAYCLGIIVIGLGIMVFFHAPPPEFRALGTPPSPLFSLRGVDSAAELTASQFDTLRRITSVLAIPPNVVRLTMIFLAGVVLVVTAARMRMLLHRSLIEAEARLSLTRYLPARLAGQVEREGLAGLREGRRQDMAVMFVDIRGFTAWSEGRDPTEVGAFVTAFREEVQAAAEAHGGLVDKFIGDAAMLLFEGAGAAPRALGCAQDLSERVQDLSLSRGETVRIGMGLHWGEVFSGVVGSDARLEYTALGDTVNIAARLEQLTKDAGLETIVSEALLEAAAGDRGPARDGWIPLEPMLLRGRSTPIALFGRGPSA